MRALILFLALACAGASAAPVRFEDTMAQRTLACTACHGREGRAGPDGYYPRIAGKPEGYLYNQLLNFREGRRHYGLMAGLLEPLSPDYLFEIAHHFASLEVPYPPPRASELPPDVLQRGRELTVQGDAARQLPACAACHGSALTGVQPNVPGLLGLPRDYLMAQLGAWRTGQRRAHAPDCMAEVARRLTPEELLAVTGFLAAQPLPANPRAVFLEATKPPPRKARKGRHAAPPAPVAAPEPPLHCGFAPLPGAQR